MVARSNTSSLQKVKVLPERHKNGGGQPSPAPEALGVVLGGGISRRQRRQQRGRSSLGRQGRVLQRADTLCVLFWLSAGCVSRKTSEFASSA